MRERTPTIGENWEEENQLRDYVFIEGDMDHFSGGNWTAIIGNNATNEVRVNHVREDVLQGMRSFFDDNLNFVELAGRDQFDLGAANFHPDRSGPNDRGAPRGAGRRLWATTSPSSRAAGWLAHLQDGRALAAAGPRSADRRPAGERRVHVPAQSPVQSGESSPIPSRFQILLGQVYYYFGDKRTNGYVQDKWQVNRNLTLNLGVRHDYQPHTPKTKDALRPASGSPSIRPPRAGRSSEAASASSTSIHLAAYEATRFGWGRSLRRSRSTPVKICRRTGAPSRSTSVCSRRAAAASPTSARRAARCWSINGIG